MIPRITYDLTVNKSGFVSDEMRLCRHKTWLYNLQVWPYMNLLISYLKVMVLYKAAFVYMNYVQFTTLRHETWLFFRCRPILWYIYGLGGWREITEIAIILANRLISPNLLCMFFLPLRIPKQFFAPPLSDASKFFAPPLRDTSKNFRPLRPKKWKVPKIPQNMKKSCFGNTEKMIKSNIFPPPPRYFPPQPIINAEDSL